MLSTNDPALLFRAGVIYEYYFHDRAQALTFLSRALARGYDRAEVEHAPALAELRKDPKYNSLQNQ